MRLWPQHHDRDLLPLTARAEETRDGGTGGNLVGSPLQGRVMLVDDVITAGSDMLTP